MEIDLFLKISILFLGVVIYFIKPRWVFLFSLCIYPIYVPLVSWLFPVLNTDDFFSYIYSIPNYIFRMYLIIFLFEFSFHTNKKLILNFEFFLPTILLCSYLLFHGFIFYQDLSVVNSEILSVFQYLLPLMLISYNERLRPLPKELFYLVCFIVLLQVVFCYLNTISIYAYPIFYVQGFIWDAFEGLVTGTFARFNYLTNYLTAIYICIAIEFYEKKRISTFFFSFISISIFIITLLSGSRLSLVSILFILLGCQLLYYKRNKKMLVVVAVIVSTIAFLLTENNAITNRISGLSRQVSGLSSTIQTSGTDESMTTILSINLIEHYSNHLFLGCGRSDKGENAYIKAGNSLAAVKADARLVYTIIEYGIVGFILYLFFFGGIYNYMKSNVRKKDKKKIDLIFLYFIFNTITEMGLFDLFLNQIIYIYVFTYLVKNTYSKHIETSFLSKKI